MGGERILEADDVADKIMIAQMMMMMAILMMNVLMMMRLMISVVELWRDGNAL